MPSRLSHRFGLPKPDALANNSAACLHTAAAPPRKPLGRRLSALPVCSGVVLSSQTLRRATRSTSGRLLALFQLVAGMFEEARVFHFFLPLHSPQQQKVWRGARSTPCVHTAGPRRKMLAARGAQAFTAELGVG